MDRDKKQWSEYIGVHYEKALINWLYSPSREKILGLWAGDIQWIKLIAPILPINLTVIFFLQSCTVKQYGKAIL